MTVVDLVNFDSFFYSEEDIPDRFENVPVEDDRSVAQLMTDQVMMNSVLKLCA